MLAANQAMVLLYWEIGNAILARQEREGWGAGTIDRLSHDLREAFPDMRGFSPRNLKYMRAFASAWPEREIVQEVLAQIPLGVTRKSRDRRRPTMTWIEKEIVIPADGKLPPDFRAAFGRKARVTVYLQEQEQGETTGGDILSDVVGKVRAFRGIDDPVAWQRNLRASWE